MVDDGSLLELGHSFFVLRNSPVTRMPAHLAGDTNAHQLPALPVGMQTFVPDLAIAFETLAQVAASSISITITGETGTGKEVLATAIHELSRRSGEFIAINCGALPPTQHEQLGVRDLAVAGEPVVNRLVRAVQRDDACGHARDQEQHARYFQNAKVEIVGVTNGTFGNADGTTIGSRQFRTLGPNMLAPTATVTIPLVFNNVAAGSTVSVDFALGHHPTLLVMDGRSQKQVMIFGSRGARPTLAGCRTAGRRQRSGCRCPWCSCRS